MVETRAVPRRIRIHKLQEAHIQPLVALEQATTAMYHAIGFDAAEVPARPAVELATLPRQHEVYVAEADDEVAGYAAWRDEAPGVAYVEELGVDPSYQRMGIGTKLMAAIRERAGELGMTHVVLRAWDKATWAQAFYQRQGFRRLDDEAPERVATWRELRDSGRPLTRPGESILWLAL